MLHVVLSKSPAISREKRLHHDLHGRVVVLRGWKASISNSLNQFTSRYCNQLDWRFCTVFGKSLCRCRNSADRHRAHSGELTNWLLMLDRCPRLRWLCWRCSSFSGWAETKIIITNYKFKHWWLLWNLFFNLIFSLFFSLADIAEQTWSTLRLNSNNCVWRIRVLSLPLLSHRLRNDNRHNFSVFLWRLWA